MRDGIARGGEEPAPRHRLPLAGGRGPPQPLHAEPQAGHLANRSVLLLQIC